MSLFGGGKRASRERTEEDRLRALEERQRRRDAANRVRAERGTAPAADAPASEPSVAAEPSASREPAEPDAAPAQTPRPAGVPPRQPAPARAAWPPPLDPPAAAADPLADLDELFSPAAPADEAPVTPQPAPREITPDPPAQPPAQAFELPDHREIAVHRRRSLAGRAATRTIVSPPGDVAHGAAAGPSRRRKIVRAVLGLLLLLVLVSQWLLWQPLKGGGEGEVTVEIPDGASASQVAERLAEAGVIDSASLFNVRALISGKRDALSAGTLTLKEDMSYGAALDALSGAVPAAPKLTSVTIPEGLSIREVDQRFRRRNQLKDYAAAAKTALARERSSLREEIGMPKATTTLEGTLFPATYELLTGFSGQDLVDLQLQALRQNLAGVSMTKAKRAGLSQYEVLIVASMVEREARLTRERPLIAAVIYNRLKAKMPLGIDATFRYASGNWTDPIRQSELDKDGPYNSRTRQGLPPTPIGNPGLASIKAAANPKDVDYLYFVVKPGRCGEHAFSSTAEKFAEDSAKYNDAREAAGGSPSTC